jgi:hypothetical protein
MKTSDIALYAGVLSIPLSIAAWFLKPEFLGVDYSALTDTVLREILLQAHAERWGIFVGLWPATLIGLSIALRQQGK